MKSVMDIPRIIPWYRLSGVIFALVLSSSIFSTSFILITSLDNSDQDFFGTSDNIFVYYNQDASTPFTSQVPLAMRNSFDLINGVLQVSPELFQPIFVKNQASYVRGVDFERFFDLENAFLIEGRFPLLDNPFEVLVGSDLNQRLELDVLDEIFIESTLSEEIILVKVVGIFQSNSITADEILINLNIAQSLAEFDSFTVTHLRVRIDNSVAGSTEIIKQATRVNELDLVINAGNDTTWISSLELQVFDALGQNIYTSQVSEKLVISLLSGVYEIRINSNATTVYSTTIVMVSDLQNAIDLAKYQYGLTIEISFQGTPLAEMSYDIFEADGRKLGEFDTDEFGAGKHELTPGEYYVLINEGANMVRTNFSIPEEKFLSISLPYFQGIDINELVNGSIIPANRFRFSLEGITESFDLFLNNNFSPIRINNEFGKKSVDFNLDNGNYVIQVKHQLNPNIILFTLEFSVDANLTLLESSNLFDGVHYKPNTIVSVSRAGMSQYANLQNSNINLTVTDNEFQIELPSVPGFYSIFFSALSNAGLDLQRRWNIVIDEEAQTIGWVSATPSPTVKPNETLSLWTNATSSSISANIGRIYNKSNSWFYEIPNIANGNYSVEFTLGSVIEKLNFTIIPSFGKLFTINNATGIISQPNIISNEIWIEYVDQNIYDSENFWEFWFDEGDGYFRIYPRQKISIQDRSNSYFANLLIRSLVTGSEEVVQFTLFDPSNSTDNLNLFQGFPSILLDGIIDLRTSSNHLSNFTIERDGVNFIPISISDRYLQLSPGNYSIFLTNPTTNDTRVWMFEVPFWKRPAILSANLISLRNSYLVNQTSVQVGSGRYIIDGRYQDFRFSNILIINQKRNISTSEYEITIFNIVSGDINLVFSNGTQQFLPYNGKILFNDNNPVNVSLVVNGFNMLGDLLSNSTEFQLGVIPVSTNFTIVRSDGTPPNNYSIILELLETQELIELYLTNVNSTFSLDLYPQVANITLLRGDTIFYSRQQQLMPTIEIVLGRPQLTIFPINPSTGQISLNSIITLSNKVGQSISIKPGLAYRLSRDTYSISVVDGNFNGNRSIELKFDQTINFLLNPILRNITIEINDLPLGSTYNVTLSHNVIDFETRVLNIQRNNVISLQNIPVGFVNITFEGSWGLVNETLFILENIQTYLLTIFSSSLIETFDISADIIQKVRDTNFASSLGDGYLDEYLAGALVIVQIILFSILIVISLVIITNIIEIMRVLTIESRRELFIIANIGATDKQILLSYLKPIIYTIIFISSLGYAMAFGILSIMISLNQTIYFGHKFVPELISFELVLINFVYTTVTVAISAVIAYRNEFLRGDRLP